MKKLLCGALALSLAVTLFVNVSAAKGGNGGGNGGGGSKSSTSTSDSGKGSGNGNGSAKTDAAGTESGTTSTDDASTKLEKQYKDKEARNQLIKEIVAERKANKDNSTPVFVNGKEVKFDVPPVIKFGRTLIPVRAVTNALGADVQWDAETKTVTITKDGTTITIVLGSNIATVNGTQVQLDASAELVSNRTMVPIRFIAQTLKQKVEWDTDTGSVIIEDDSGTAADPGTTPDTAADPAADTTTTDPAADTTTTTDTTTTDTSASDAAAGDAAQPAAEPQPPANP